MYSRDSTATSLKLLELPVLHPFHPPTASTTSSSRYLQKVLKIKLHCNYYLSRSLHHEVFLHAPEHFHLLPSLLSSQTSYPLIGLCRSNPWNWLFNWQLIQASNVNYASLYIRHLTNRVAHAELQPTFLVITPSNAHVYAKLVFTIWFVMELCRL